MVEGLRFRRQHPLGNYIADFYCHKLKLVIEADGKIHDDEIIKQHDILRENDLKEMGYVILRFTNERIEKEGDKVLEEIRTIVERLNKQY
jgi:cyclase